MPSNTLVADIAIDIIDLLTSYDENTDGLTAAEITRRLMTKFDLRNTRYNYKHIYDRVIYWLGSLTDGGIVVFEKRGRHSYYKPSPTTKRGQAYIKLIPKNGGEEIVAAGDTLFVDTESGTIVVFLNNSSNDVGEVI